MIQINQLRLRIPHTREELTAKIKKTLHIHPQTALTYEIRRRSIDARKKPELYYVYQIWAKVDNERQVIRRSKNANVTSVKEPSCPKVHVTASQSLSYPPIVIGAGPAGLFCAYQLTMLGVTPIVCERGKPIEQRRADVERFWESGVLDPSSNVQFGEGGAGTFSDGKLNTSVKDPTGRIRRVLDTFVQFGAPSEILYEQKPHIGTDILSDVIANMRQYLIGKGCQFHFRTQVTDLELEAGRLRGVIAEEDTEDGRCQYRIPTDVAVLAVGHSARDTFARLRELGIPMEAKSFAAGFRVEHPQRMIDEAMYGVQEGLSLPAAPYKVTSNFPNGRGVYSFCMCPGGYVVNSASGAGQTVVNGMSYSGRDGTNANSAIIISVSPKDFGADDPLAGIRYQQSLEKRAYELGDGRIVQQLYGDYRQNCLSTAYGTFGSQTKGACTFANLRGLFSEEMEKSFLGGMEHFSRIIPGFDRADAILSGVESRTSSPVRILRSETLESPVQGLYPCGEGAGYAGGITSAAIDGLKVAEAIISNSLL